jgi:APA family basic amino acid/polyamine antiporter
VLTVLKLLALVAIVVVGFLARPAAAQPVGSSPAAVEALTVSGCLFALLQVFWSYSGSSDPVKMAEEIRDVRRAMPLALIGAALSLTVVYVLVNFALLRIVPADEMAGLEFVPGEMMARVFGPGGRTAMLAVAMLVCLAALSSAILATIRVTYALARDGLAFRFMSHMSSAQAPVPALLVVAAFAIALVLIRSFNQIVGIYYFASAILFGLAYASLIVFRWRETGFPAHVFRCPLGPLQSVLLIVIYLALAANVAIASPLDALGSVSLFVLVAALYGVWKRRFPSRRPNAGRMP